MEGEVDGAGEGYCVAAYCSEIYYGDFYVVGEGLEAREILGWEGDDDTGLGFAEEGSVPAAFDVEVGGEAEAAEDAGLGDGDGESTVGAVVGGGEETFGDGAAAEGLDPRFQVEVDGGSARDEVVAYFEIFTAREGLG